ncbi:MAG: DUF4294 domain-containing protein [Chitinophagales bacterium]
MKKLILSIAISITFFQIVTAQDGYEYSDEITVLYARVFDGDTIPYVNIPEVDIVGITFANQTEEYWYNYYLQRVQKVYPYYQIAQDLVDDLEDKKENSKKKEFKKFKKQTKEELMNEFEKELRELKVSEGKVLVKMINRNSGIAFYDLIKEYQSGVKAWAYNIVAKRYDYDLKSPYDATEEDNIWLEQAIKTVENTYSTIEASN